MTVDTTLWEKIKKGDKLAFEQLFRELYPKMCSYMLQHTHHQVEAEEIVQRVFVKIWSKREQLEIKTSIKSYLYRAAYYDFLDGIEKRKTFNRAIEEFKFIIASEQLKEDSDITEKKIALLKATIDNLPKRCREILILSKWDKMKHKEISEKLDISTKTIEAQLSIAYKKIREAFENKKDLFLFLLYDYFK